MNIEKHWLLKKHLNEIEILSLDFPRYYQSILRENGLPVDTDENSKLLVDWNKVPAHYSFFYDYENCEVSISHDLSNSLIAFEQTVIMDFGYNGPIIRLDTKLFINNWYDFVKAAFFETCVFAENQRLVMEFAEENYFLHSNFIIRN